MASLRVREILKERAAARQAARAEERRRLEEIQASMLTRAEAARYLRVSEFWLRDAWSKGIGPRAVKLGCSRQARVLYPREELDRWRRDPLGYDTPSRDEAIGPFEPPGRGHRS